MAKKLLLLTTERENWAPKELVKKAEEAGYDVEVIDPEDNTKLLEYCVYFTYYLGNLLPPFYIGSTAMKRLKKGYRGSVNSVKYKAIWKDELKNHPELFKSFIISQHSDRQEATIAENNIQVELNVTKNAQFINMRCATIDGIFGFSGEKHFNYGQNIHTSEILAKMGRSLSKTMTGKTKETCPRIQKAAITFSNTQKGKTKENCERVRKSAETKKGRTKENHEGTRRGAEVQTGRTKFTHSGLASMARKNRKTNDFQESEIINLYLQGQTPKDIYSTYGIVNNLGEFVINRVIRDYNEGFK